VLSSRDEGNQVFELNFIISAREWDQFLSVVKVPFKRRENSFLLSFWICWQLFLKRLDMVVLLPLAGNNGHVEYGKLLKSFTVFK